MDYMKSSAQMEDKLQRLNLVDSRSNEIMRKIGPSVPPKPHKNQPKAEIPQSSYIGQICKPLYSQRLQFADTNITNSEKSNLPKGDDDNSLENYSSLPSLLQRKKNALGLQNVFDNEASKVTLDNPAILEQQLEVLAHHKKQLEKKGLLPKSSLQNVPKLSSTSLVSTGSDVIYANVLGADIKVDESSTKIPKENKAAYSNVNAHRKYFEKVQANKIYSNLAYEKNDASETQIASNAPPFSIRTSDAYVSDEIQDDIQPPSSPVSSSYSELRRANDIFSAKREDVTIQDSHISGATDKSSRNMYPGVENYINIKYKNEFGNQDNADYYGVGSFSQTSSTYESIYEPINPRPPSQLSSRLNLLNFSPYVNSQHGQISNMSSGATLSNSISLNTLSLGGTETSPDNLSLYSSGGGNERDHSEVETLSNYLVHSIDSGNDADNYGVCFKCNERVLGESSGCTAMNQIYHISCFTCSQCQINLQGKPFYALDGKPFCEYDYLQTLEKCSVCMKPILERILRATGKPYHPQCFTCIICGKSLDGIPFTVDATNQNYCIEDFHKKFAPRCCVCKEPIMPEPGEEETVRVVALDRSFHFECYKCEDCGLLLSSEAEGRGCYPLDDHVLCKSCNAQRVQLLTNCISTEI